MDNDQDQQVRDRITRKISKYEIKISDLRRLLENFQINQENERPRPTTPPREVDINPQVPTTPLYAPQQILPQPDFFSIQQSSLYQQRPLSNEEVVEYLQRFKRDNNLTQADLARIFGYADKENSTGQAAVSDAFSGRTPPSAKLVDAVNKRRLIELSTQQEDSSPTTPMSATSQSRLKPPQSSPEIPLEREDRRSPIWPPQSSPVKPPIIIPSPFPHLPGNPNKPIIPAPKPEPIPVPMGQPVTPTAAPVQRQPVTPIIPITAPVQRYTGIYPSGPGTYDMTYDPDTGETGWINREEEEEEDRRQDRRDKGWDSDGD